MIGKTMKKTKLKKTDSLSWFTNPDVQSSVAETLLHYFLSKNNIPFEQEVSFKGFKTPNGGHYRYDFYLPKKNLLIEYDGKGFHNSNPNDTAKNMFAKAKGIRLVRFNSHHYYNLEKELLKVC